MNMKALVLMSMLMLSITVVLAQDTEAERNAKQQELDAVCESARQKALAPIRQQKVAECVAEGKAQSDCESELANYGERAGRRAPLMYDLPECEAAEDYRTSYRRP
ncbi:MAG: hypothetical protein OEU86_08335 [Gammaproteobacteria bacterium]|nr:hypothetical protein [Gammaproteobacteria bacterium]